MTTALGIFLSLFSVLIPQKMWFAPDQPITVNIKTDQAVTLVLTDFNGKLLEAKSSVDVAAGSSADVKAIYPAVANIGTYLLYAVAKGGQATSGPPKNFLGTPLVIEVRSNGQKDNAAAPMVIHVEPLRYAKMTTDAGAMTMMFYYDVAPNTVDSFLTLSEQGYYDGLTFHRIVPGFVIQGGDPMGNGQGGPGYHVEAEFNDHPHVEGVLSMARTSEPNSAGSQFFVCLNYEKTKNLDNQYTAFGKVIEGFDTTVAKIAASPLADAQQGTPQTLTKITSVEVISVTADKNPYVGSPKGAMVRVKNEVRRCNVDQGGAGRGVSYKGRGRGLGPSHDGYSAERRTTLAY